MCQIDQELNSLLAIVWKTLPGDDDDDDDDEEKDDGKAGRKEINYLKDFLTLYVADRRHTCAFCVCVFVRYVMMQEEDDIDCYSMVIAALLMLSTWQASADDRSKI